MGCGHLGAQRDQCVGNVAAGLGEQLGVLRTGLRGQRVFVCEPRVGFLQVRDSLVRRLCPGGGHRRAYTDEQRQDQQPPGKRSRKVRSHR
jgi:hypothetical protein